MANLSMVLFRDGQSESADAASAIVREIVRSGGDRYSLIEADVHERSAFAARYNVRTTPTILLMKSGAVVDRIVGTPTTSLVQTLLDARMVHATGGESRPKAS